MKNLFISVLLLFSTCTFSPVIAQNYKGLWHGYITGYGFDINSGYVLQIKEHQGNVITGRAYIYGTQFLEFQGLLDFIGTIDKGNSKVTELVIIKSETPADNIVLCVKFLNLYFNKKNEKETLTGKWSGATIGEVPCVPGKVYLERYNIANSQQSNPIPESILKIINKDGSSKMAFLTTELTPPIILNVSHNLLHLEIKDYLREDNDTVSVYFNRKPLISSLLIKNKAYKKTLRLNKLSGLNEIIIYAENLGRIPPNTCVLVVNDGITKQKVNIFSSKESSAVIYLNYVPTSRTLAEDVIEALSGKP